MPIVNARLEPPASITVAEVEVALKRSNPRRSPGLDGFMADIVFQTFVAIPEVVTALFNKCLTEGDFPTAWKKGSIVAFPKSPSMDRRDPKS